MGKKKKENSQPEQTVANNNIGYTGNVQLKLQRKGKIIKTTTLKNTGTLRLMQGLALAIQGVSESVLKGSFLPGYIDVGTKNDPAPVVTDTNLANSLLSSVGRIPVTAIYPNINGNSDGFIAKFVGVIPYNLVNGQTLMEFGLFADQRGDTLLARVIAGEEGVQLQQGMNLIIEWSLQFQNQNSSIQGE